MEDAERRQAAAVIQAAQRYRNLVRRYLATQSTLLKEGVSADELLMHNLEGFAQVQAAEEELFALLDALDE